MKSQKIGSNRPRLLGLCCSLLVLGLLLPGCSSDDDPAEPEPEPPFSASVPPGLTMQMDLDDLSSNGLLAGGGCHAVSAIAVVWANLNVAVRLAIPIAVFAETIRDSPSYLGDQTWRWNGSGGQGVNAWTSELLGTVGGGTVFWDLRISGTAADLDEFLWISGTSDPNAGQGQWIFFDHRTPGTQTELLHVDWILPNPESDDRTLVFTIVAAGEESEGDRLSYGFTFPDASVSFFDDSSSEETVIRWNVESGAGQAVTPNQTCCWGSRPDFDDVQCP